MLKSRKKRVRQSIFARSCERIQKRIKTVYRGRHIKEIPMSADDVTLTITLPMHGTALDYSKAVSFAILSQCDCMAKTTLSNLLAYIQAPRTVEYVEGMTALVFGKTL